MNEDPLTPSERKLFGDISMTVISLWKNNTHLRAWYSGNVNRLHENLLLNAMDTRFMWGADWISQTIH